MLAAALVHSGRRYEQWSGFPGSLDKLRPGMTVEEARAVFPAHCKVWEKDADGWLARTWVVSPDAVPVRVMGVMHGALPDPCPLSLVLGQFKSTFGAEVYFDGDGKLVGVHANGFEGGECCTWKAPWGVLHE